MTPMVGETFFVDTNVFLTATDSSRSQHEAAKALLSDVTRGEYQLALSSQVVREYLVVATRSAEANGLGMSQEDALRNVEIFTASPFVFCDEPESVSIRLRDLTREYELTGRHIHDANIAATMAAHGISKLVTQNTSDFQRMADVETFDLQSL